MQYVVGPISPPTAQHLADNIFQYDRADMVKRYYTSMERARRAAQELAVATPGVQYGVFGVVEILEALAPAAPKILRKTINEAGEVVVAA